MASWDALIAAIKDSYVLDSEGPGEVALTLERKDGQGEERAQRTMLRRYTAWGEDFVEFRSAFSEVGLYEPLALLEESLTLPLGALAVHGNYLVVVQKAPLAYTSVEGLLMLLTRMTQLADVLEQRQGADRF